jgi:hypothetical protein
MTKDRCPAFGSKWVLISGRATVIEVDLMIRSMDCGIDMVSFCPFCFIYSSYLFGLVFKLSKGILLTLLQKRIAEKLLVHLS